MPEGSEYLLAAYFIWVLVFGSYVSILYSQRRNLQKNIKNYLKRLQEKE